MSLRLTVGDQLPSVGLRATDGYLLNLRSHVTRQAAVLLFFAGPTLAGAARRKGMKAIEALVAGQALLGAALAAGLGEKESRDTILSGLNAGAAKPRHGVSA